MMNLSIYQITKSESVSENHGKTLEFVLMFPDCHKTERGNLLVGVYKKLAKKTSMGRLSFSFNVLTLSLWDIISP